MADSALFRGPLTEQYQPRTWADVVGQDKIVQRVQALAKRGLAGRAYWISGQSGTGKTTIARLIAQEVADADFQVPQILLGVASEAAALDASLMAVRQVGAQLAPNRRSACARSLSRVGQCRV